MMMRGVEKQHSGAMTSAMLGAFRTRKKTRDEFLALVNHRSNGFQGSRSRGLGMPRP
jgi:GTP cyclohydrolase I